jgi:hypothetical protein
MLAGGHDLFTMPCILCKEPIINNANLNETLCEIGIIGNHGFFLCISSLSYTTVRNAVKGVPVTENINIRI